MKIIIKYFALDKTWSTLYLIMEEPLISIVYTGGFISNTTFDHLQKENLLHEVDAIEIIEKYFKCAALIADAKSYKYFEVKK